MPSPTSPEGTANIGRIVSSEDWGFAIARISQRICRQLLSVPSRVEMPERLIWCSLFREPLYCVIPAEVRQVAWMLCFE